MTQKEQLEQWKTIQGTNGAYDVSNMGRARGPSGKILKPTLMKIGYCMISLSLKSHGVKKKYLHALVAESFLGHKPTGYVINHINGDKKDNRATNLEFLSRKDNGSHWAGKKTPYLRRIKSSTCGRGHIKRPDDTHCLECRRLAGTFSPPAGTEWREIDDAPGYQISNDGRVWSNKTNRLMRPGKNLAGYSYINPRVNGRQKPLAIHRLVATTFIEKIGLEMVVDHINGNKLDNHASNLRVCSRSENIQAFKITRKTNDNHGFKLKEATVASIKWLWEQGMATRLELEKKYKLSSSHVYTITSGRSWKHVKPRPLDGGPAI